MLKHLQGNWPVFATLAVVVSLLVLARYADALGPLHFGALPNSQDSESFLFRWNAEETVAAGTIGLVVATALLFVATYLLWRTTLSALRDAHATSERQAREFAATLAETKASNRIAQSQLIASHRPWLKFNAELLTDVRWNGDHIPLAFDLRVDNVGSAPAMNIRIASMLTVSLDNRKAHKEMCDGWRDARAEHGSMLFPGEYYVERHEMRIAAEQLVQMKKEFAEMGITDTRGPIWPTLFGCAVYQSSHGSANHITAFSYRFGQMTLGDPSRLPRGFVPEEANFQRGDVVFQRDFLGFWAD